MNLRRRSAGWIAAGRQAALVAWIGYFWLLDSPLAWAKKKQVVEAAPEKSYVLPYLIVVALVAVGMMTICRPSRRADEASTMNRKDEEE